MTKSHGQFTFYQAFAAYSFEVENLKALLQSVLTILYLYIAAPNRSEKHCLQIKGTFSLTMLVTDKKGTSKFHSYKWQEGILFYFILKPSKKQAGIHSLSEDGNSINNYFDISAVSTAFSSTCCSSRETSGQKLMASQREKS